MGILFGSKDLFPVFKAKTWLTPSDIPFSEIDIQDIDLDFIRKVTLTEVYEYMNFLTEVRGNKAAARSRKVSSLRTYFKYLTNKVNKLEKNPIEELETPKTEKESAQIFDIRAMSRIAGRCKRSLC